MPGKIFNYIKNIGKIKQGLVKGGLIFAVALLMISASILLYIKVAEFQISFFSYALLLSSELCSLSASVLIICVGGALMIEKDCG